MQWHTEQKKTTASKSTDKQAEDGRENRFLQDQT